MSVTGDNMVGGVKELSSGQPLILRFYAWADPAQMPLRHILVKKNSVDANGVSIDPTEHPIELKADSIGNRKLKCTNRGWCQWTGGDAYKYQIPCDGNWDCVFYNGSKTSLNLVQGACMAFD